jgi:hypothetical protein
MIAASSRVSDRRTWPSLTVTWITQGVTGE